MYCILCGAQLPDDVGLCPHCGSPRGDPAGTPVVAASNEALLYQCNDGGQTIIVTSRQIIVKGPAGETHVPLPQVSRLYRSQGLFVNHLEVSTHSGEFLSITCGERHLQELYDVIQRARKR